MKYSYIELFNFSLHPRKISQFIALRYFIVFRIEFDPKLRQGWNLKPRKESMEWSDPLLNEEHKIYFFYCFAISPAFKKAFLVVPVPLLSKFNCSKTTINFNFSICARSKELIGCWGLSLSILFYRSEKSQFDDKKQLFMLREGRQGQLLHCDSFTVTLDDPAHVQTMFNIKSN